MPSVRPLLLDLLRRHEELRPRVVAHRDDPALPTQNRALAEDWLMRLDRAHDQAQTPMRVAFLAQVGTGKSTLIGVATGLRLPGEGDPERWSVLPVGPGRTTLGELVVEPRDQDELTLEVEPVPAEVLELEARLLAEDDWHAARGDTKGGGDGEAGEELYKLLRRWLALNPEDARRSLRDEARAAESLAAFTDALRARLNAQERAKPLTLSFASTEEGLRALREALCGLMVGGLQGAPAPRRTVLGVPRHMVPAEVDALIDTQGIEPNATEGLLRARPSLNTLLDDPQVALVICSAFRSAPDAGARTLLSALKTRQTEHHQPRRATRLVVVDDRREGHEADKKERDRARRDRLEECEDLLRRQELRGLMPEDGIVSIDARSEGDTLRGLLAGVVEEAWRIRHEQWAEVIGAAESAIEHLKEAEEAAALREVDLRLLWALEVELSQRPPPPPMDPLTAIGKYLVEHEPFVQHWSHVRAAIRRRGYYEKLELIERGAIYSIQPQVDAFLTAWNSAISRREMLGINISDQRIRMHKRLLSGQTGWRLAARTNLYSSLWCRIVRRYLKSPAADALWQEAERRWGQGPGYVADIARLFTEEGERAKLRLPDGVQLPSIESVLPPRPKLLFLRSVRLKNFRAVTEGQLELSETTVLVGDNAQGKTAWIEAIAAGLGVFLSSFGVSNAPTLLPTDLRESLRLLNGIPDQQLHAPAQVTLTGELQGRGVEWQVERGLDGPIERLDDTVRNVAASIGREVMESRSRPLPVIAYYSTQRLWPLELRAADRDRNNRQEAYRDALSATSSHEQMLGWVRDFSMAEFTAGKPLPQLEGVRAAVVRCVRGAKRFYYDAPLKTLCLLFEDGRVVPFPRLSDGYRNLVAMVADIAWRARSLNPAARRAGAELVEGVVLIDEIDLHLHPRWQRHVLADLQRAFPRLQII
jgi:predicted ATP-binding protein involved in virulence